jgi:hypothetical protein
MSCQIVRDFLLDETAPHPEGLEDHLSTCAECRAFKLAHLHALSLRGAELPSRHAALAVVRRQVGAFAAATLAGVALVGLLWLERPIPVIEPPLALQPEFAPVVVEVAGDDEEQARAQLDALRALAVSTRRPIDSTPLTRDVAYASFGRIPVWLAPGTTRPLRSLGRAVSPLVQRTEE